MDKKPFLRLEAGKTRDFVKIAEFERLGKFGFSKRIITKLTLAILPQPRTAVKQKAAAC